MHRSRRALIIGWRGGVGYALLGLLRRHPLALELLRGFDELLLVDADEDAPSDPGIPGARVLPPQRIDSGAALARLILEHRIDQVIELGRVDTFECLSATAAAGADYLSTNLENWESVTATNRPWERHTLPCARRLLPGSRPTITRGSHLVGSGMNPGIVNVLAFQAAEALRARARAPIEIDRLYVTEVDTSEPTVPVPEGALPMTWSPASCIDELTEPRSMYVDHGEVMILDHRPTHARYEARCGHDQVAGYAVAHDELMTLSYRFPRAELAFIYQVMPAALRALARTSDPSTLTGLGLYPPVGPAPGAGYDRVGVLVGAEGAGELWVGIETAQGEARRYGTNATELQVAAGVLAGWRQLGERPGIHTTEELDHRRYLRDIEAVLGPALVVDDPEAPTRPLRERTVWRRPGPPREDVAAS
ncbi:MAG: hypothetical protein R3B09_25745 [Nannocystaceae bacterium]